MKILVTGGAGFLGSNLVDKLVENNEVYIFDNLSTGLESNINTNAKFINLDLSTLKDQYEFDIVVHLAAQINLRKSMIDFDFDAEQNILGTLNILKNVKFKKIIFSSTGGAIYSPKASLPWNELSETHPQSFYGLSKLSAENYIRLFCKNNGIKYTILRFANIYGPRQNSKCEAGVISIFMDNIKNNLPLQIFGDGSQTRDFIYIDDVVSAIEKAIYNDHQGTFNISTDAATSINSIVNIFKKELKYSNIEYLPPIKGELYHSRLSYNKYKVIANWFPIVNIDEGIKKFIKYSYVK